MFTTPHRATGALLFFLVSALWADAAAPAEKRELLAEHDTVAVFQGAKFHRCLGRTALCPDRCGHSGEFAEFKIVGYVAYNKPGKFGDEKQAAYRVQVSDFQKQPVGDKSHRDQVAALKPGDHVRLVWRHDYVTRDGASFPERPLVKLEKVTAEEAAKLLPPAK